ncbi:hypothetical protein DPMN_052699 [Dreissena polymorpha]|uniref:Uncharacterized protein n=1 Tax=Dreissena polymorpha TaxID=45954 RepID=A0A9D4CK59_DREPO|nr:hypothetical protein DPMN_052699 [Dreissena polymorpha]
MSLLHETMETHGIVYPDFHMKIISSSSALVCNDGKGSSADEAVNRQSTDV